MTDTDRLLAVAKNGWIFIETEDGWLVLSRTSRLIGWGATHIEAVDFAITAQPKVAAA